MFVLTVVRKIAHFNHLSFSYCFHVPQKDVVLCHVTYSRMARAACQHTPDLQAGFARPEIRKKKKLLPGMCFKSIVTNLTKSYEEFSSLRPMFPPVTFFIFPPAWGGCSKVEYFPSRTKKVGRFYPV